MTKYVVTGQAFSRRTGLPIGKIRNETIDTKSNVLFKGAKNTADVKAYYESFWNDLDPHSHEVVRVSKVVVKGIGKKQDVVKNILNKF
jgi:hypothetical protein